MISQDALDEMAAIRNGEMDKAKLFQVFFETPTYRKMRKKISTLSKLVTQHWNAVVQN